MAKLVHFKRARVGFDVQVTIVVIGIGVTKRARVGSFGSPITVCGHWSGAGRVSSRAPDHNSHENSLQLDDQGDQAQNKGICFCQLSHLIGSPRQNMNILYKGSWTILLKYIQCTFSVAMEVPRAKNVDNFFSSVFLREVYLQLDEKFEPEAGAPSSSRHSGSESKFVDVIVAKSVFDSGNLFFEAEFS